MRRLWRSGGLPPTRRRPPRRARPRRRPLPPLLLPRSQRRTKGKRERTARREEGAPRGLLLPQRRKRARRRGSGGGRGTFLCRHCRAGCEGEREGESERKRESGGFKVRRERARRTILVVRTVSLRHSRFFFLSRLSHPSRSIQHLALQTERYLHLEKLIISTVRALGSGGEAERQSEEMSGDARAR